MIEELEMVELLETYSQCSHFDSEEWEDNKVKNFMKVVDQEIGFVFINI